MTTPEGRGIDEGPVKVRRALLSVSEKTGVIELATALHDLTIEILSTGGTASMLRAAGIPVVEVADITGVPEMLGGRVKTLHPKIHAGILAKRCDPEHLQQLQEQGIAPIDLVVVNLYPFEATVARADAPLEEAIEQIDIGGPSLIRAAAKNFDDVAVLVDPADYATVVTELRRDGACLSRGRRLRLARKAFAHTAHYDTLIAGYLERHIDGERAGEFPDLLELRLFKVQGLRYGENPHQRAALYRRPEAVEAS
ncbi:MAG TPA: bifunctional phosphoribosylaminoimidazolecarboxamide formyltransferase/IMP cyclohydrolase, partial [Candidatus Methylomirabilis sp.]|nr:bifunctional phosphoribosylaminoimidazolecarboxamide formyltransferase/IMP cyclohydrolase [Candidatus Methylomirabilis sp.]